MKLSTVFVLFALTLLLVAGCEVPAPGENETPEEFLVIVDGETPEGEAQEFPIEIGEITPEGEEEMEEPEVPTEGVVIEATEGDLVELKPEAVDPDGDVVFYSFTEPFNENGRWQTQEGDAGQYLVTVTASDGKDDTTQDVLVVIQKGNKAPIVECPEEVIVKEGDTVSLDCNIYDPEGESVLIEYSGFMDTSTKETTFDDAGEYTVQVKAGDGEKEETDTVDVKVLDVNRAPEITGVPEQIIATETDVVTLTPTVVDPDGDEVVIAFSEPFNDKGIWVTKIGDAGEHKASVTVTDGKSTLVKEFTIDIGHKNTAPVIEDIEDIEVLEGETIKIPIEVNDREGDEIEVTVKGWMNTRTYTTTYDDAGEYTVTVVASDGKLENTETFKVEVVDRNRPPIFKVPA